LGVKQACLSLFNHTQFKSIPLKLLSTQCLGKDVSNLFIGGTKIHWNLALFNIVSQKVMVMYMRVQSDQA